MTTHYPSPQPYPMPSASFSGAYGDNATGAWFPARADVSHGVIPLWVALPNGWAQYFSVPAGEVAVKSAAQGITLVLGGVADVLDKPSFEMGVDLARTVNVAGAAYSFQLGGGPAFLAAAQQSGAQTSRTGYGLLLELGCGGGILVVLLVTVVTLAVIGL